MNAKFGENCVYHGYKTHQNINSKNECEEHFPVVNIEAKQ